MSALLVLVGLLSGGDCLSIGLEAAQAKQWDEAFRAFRAARARPGCDTPTVLFNLARSGEMRVEQGEPRLACEVAELYAQFMDSEPAPALARLAIEGRSAMALECARQAPPLPPPAPTRPRRDSRALEWGLTTGAVVTAIGAGLTYALALQRIDDRDAAAGEYAAAGRALDPIGVADARLDFESHRDAARGLGYTSYGLAGAALVLTGLSIWAWQRPRSTRGAVDTAASGPRVAPGYLGWGGRF